jgi:hypothetical protein
LQIALKANSNGAREMGPDTFNVEKCIRPLFVEISGFAFDRIRSEENNPFF